MSTSPLPKKTLLLTTTTGQIYQIDFTDRPHIEDPLLIDWDLSVSKILIGKFQMQRTRYLTLDEVEIENITHTGETPSGASGDTQLTVYYSLDGKNQESPQFPATSIDEGGLLKYVCRITGQNFSFQLRGTFNINTIILTTHVNGRR